jgi:pSer/pThr/pTyr-binding forkhead associated (FHA) protein
MKVSLVVVAAGKASGKSIPITLSQFVIGRAPECQLRPASAVISKRHCAVLVRGGKAYLRDFDSTNGTLVNDQQVKGEIELHNDDVLKVGPLEFKVKIEAAVPVERPTPVPPPKKKPAGALDDDSVAQMLLDMQEEGGASAADPEGNTVTDITMPPPSEQETLPNEPPKEKKDSKKPAPAKPAHETTSKAAEAILEKYMRRPRS